jgi:hypothetical protein
MGTVHWASTYRRFLAELISVPRWLPRLKKSDGDSDNQRPKNNSGCPECRQSSDNREKDEKSVQSQLFSHKHGHKKIVNRMDNNHSPSGEQKRS